LAGGTGTGGDGDGGGIDNSGTLSVIDSTFSGNSATGGKGGAPGDGVGGGIANSDALSLTNSTFNANSAVDLGGAIASSGAASISYITTADNSAADGGGIAVTAGSPPVVSSIDSVFQNVVGGNLSVVAGSSFRSLGHNLFSDTPNVSLQPTDLVNTEPLLGPLANNGGPTLTQALLPGSPAINAGIPVAGIHTDQRGAPRPAHTAPDIGAFQVQPSLTNLSASPQAVAGRPNALVLRFDLPLDPARAVSAANYQLVRAANGGMMPILSVQHDAAAQSMTLAPRARLRVNQTYELTVIGTPPGGLTTSVGAYLAGAGAGQPGPGPRRSALERVDTNPPVPFSKHISF
jgi:predicted outer membrane repeat protein